MSMNSLEMVLKDQGKYEQAEEMLRQALRLREMAMGKEHPSTLMSMNNLAGALMDQGKYEQAEEMLQQS
jgi:tetratricopeptide (TPR) repeat protein